MCYTVPQSLRLFCDKQFVETKKECKIASFGQAIVQAARPAVVIAPLQLGLAAQCYHIFRSRFLIDQLNAMGFCSSYEETLIFEKNAAYHHHSNVIMKEAPANVIGPIGGIYTGLCVSKTEYNIIVACDIPFIKSDIILSLIKNIKDYEIILPVEDDKKHPLCAIYSKKIKDRIKKLIDRNELKLQRILSYFNTKEILFAGRTCFININTQEEVKNAEKNLIN